MFTAVIVDKDESGQITAKINEVEEHILPEQGEVLIQVAYAGLNYKDGLCLNGGGGLIREFPRIPGIECAGIVLESQDPRFQTGDKVIATGFRIGEVWHGGYAQKARLKAEWLVPLPAGLELRQTMMFGTAGLTAMLAINALEAHGLSPAQTSAEKAVLVTGAAGGVGSFAITMLAALGYHVAAVTGRIDEAGDYLKSLGASMLIARDELAEISKRPMESERWAGCIDNVGGAMLARILGQLCYGASLAAIGNTGGVNVPANVLPFLLRGVNILGIDSVLKPLKDKKAAWDRLAEIFPLARLEDIATEITLDELLPASQKILNGQIQGRYVVKL